ncbi:MAG: hypothetical protein QW469_00490 [Candidatus Aenigmatarchaeota archaeon]
MEIIKFAEATDQAIYQTGDTGVPLSETDAIVVLSPDVNPTSVISIGNNTQGTLYIDFTKGSLDGVEIKLYGSPYPNPSSTQWFSETEESSSSGVLNLNDISINITSNSKKMWHFPLGANRSYKITIKGLGTSNANSSLTLILSLRSN